MPLAAAARYNVDKEAARVALDALMEDKAFRAAVVEEVSSWEVKCTRVVRVGWRRWRLSWCQ